jgi:hypothetical protein
MSAFAGTGKIKTTFYWTLIVFYVLCPATIHADIFPIEKIDASGYFSGSFFTIASTSDTSGKKNSSAGFACARCPFYRLPLKFHRTPLEKNPPSSSRLLLSTICYRAPPC